MLTYLLVLIFLFCESSVQKFVDNVDFLWDFIHTIYIDCQVFLFWNLSFNGHL